MRTKLDSTSIATGRTLPAPSAAATELRPALPSVFDDHRAVGPLSTHVAPSIAPSSATSPIGVRAQALATANVSLIDVVDRAHPEVVTAAAVEADLRVMQARVESDYAYIAFHPVDFAAVVDSCVAKLKRLEDKDGNVKLTDGTAILVQAAAAFDDFHHRIDVRATTGLARDTNLTLNIKLDYFADDDVFMVHGGNAELFAQLSRRLGSPVDDAALAQHQLVLTHVNGTAIHALVDDLDSVLPYTNPVTKRQYAGLLLGTGTGVIELAHLMKDGVLDETSAIELTFTSRVSGVTVSAKVNPQQLGPYTLDDPQVAIAGRPPRTPPAGITPEAIAETCNLHFDYDAATKIAFFRMPTWVADGAGSAEARKAFYTWVTRSLAEIPRDPEVAVVIDTRGNRGGDPILWRAFVEAALTREAVVTGLIQLGPELAKAYPDAKGASEEEIFVHNHEYANYSYMRGDTSITQAMRDAIEDVHAQLDAEGKIVNGKLLDHAHFGELMYSVLARNPQIASVLGPIYVVQDRYGFSANDGFIGAMRAARPDGGVVFVGETTEGGSGSGASYVLPNTGLKVATTGFLYADNKGRWFEQDINVPDVAMSLPPGALWQRNTWWREQLTQLVASSRAKG